MNKKVLVTGAKGFIGKHVCLLLKRSGYDVFEYDLNNSENELEAFVKECDFIIHLAGINRPLSIQEFYDGNSNFTKHLIDLVNNSGKKTPIIMSSSIQAELDNDYGRSKKMGEDFLLASNLPIYIYRLKNVFGKWCRPNYNSASATFCYNIAHDLPIEIRYPKYVVHYNYIDDIALEFLRIIQEEKWFGSKDILYVNPSYDCSLGHLAELLYYFKKEVESDHHLPIIHDEFELKLFKTFLDYLSDEGYSFNFAIDERGSFEELYKSKRFGQISENIGKPGITKGGHYHTYKKEIFYTVKGRCEIKQRNINNNNLIENIVNGDNPHLVNIIPYYTHSIKNIGNEDSITLMWISEIYSNETHDTYRMEVDLNEKEN